MPTTNNDTLLEKTITLALRLSVKVVAKHRDTYKEDKEGSWPVLEVPCPCRNGQYQFPPITLSAQLCQVDPVYGTVTNVVVPDLEGKQVTFVLGNGVRLGVDTSKTPGPYTAKLLGGTATLALAGATVAEWFAPGNGWARLNLNL